MAERQTGAPLTEAARGRARAAVAAVGIAGLVLAGFTGRHALAPADAAVASHQPSRSGSFLALSYNVAGLPEPFSGSEPDINTPLISPKLNGYDVVLVQEDWIDPVPPIPGVNFHHDDLISAVTHPYLSEPAPPPLGSDPRRPTAIVSDGLNYLSRLPFGVVYRQMWPGCFGGADTSDGGAADCLSQKGFSVTRLEVAAGVEIDLYNLHGEAGSTPDDLMWSAADYLVLADFINTYSVGQAVIVGGDTNLSTSSEPDATVWADFLAATGLADVCSVVDCGADAHVIDKFAFRSGSVVDVTPLTHRFERDVFQRSDGQPLSDHDALAVTFEWRAPGPEDMPPNTAVPFPTTTAPSVPPTTSPPPPAAPVTATPTFTG